MGLKINGSKGGSLTVSAGARVTDDVLILGNVVGVMFDFAGAKAPVGSLECNGQAVKKADYPELYAAIGDLWATTGGSAAPTSDSFKLPYQYITHGGVTLGLYSRGKSPNKAVGFYEDDVIRNITGKAVGNFVSSTANAAHGALSKINNASKYAYQTGTYHGSDVYLDASKSVPTGPENRPVSITVLKCIWSGR